MPRRPVPVQTRVRPPTPRMPRPQRLRPSRQHWTVVRRAVVAAAGLRPIGPRCSRPGPGRDSSGSRGMLAAPKTPWLRQPRRWRATGAARTIPAADSAPPHRRHSAAAPAARRVPLPRRDRRRLRLQMRLVARPQPRLRPRPQPRRSRRRRRFRVGRQIHRAIWRPHAGPSPGTSGRPGMRSRGSTPPGERGPGAQAANPQSTGGDDRERRHVRRDRRRRQRTDMRGRRRRWAIRDRSRVDDTD